MPSSLSSCLIHLFFFIRNLGGPVSHSSFRECGDINTFTYLKQLEFHDINITINKNIVESYIA